MTRGAYRAMVQAGVARREAISERKGHDYAGYDVLANFRRMAEMAKMLRLDPSQGPEHAALFLLLLKLDRWCNLIAKGEPPVNESIQDTVDDLHNYADLALACMLDQEADREAPVGGTILSPDDIRYWHPPAGGGSCDLCGDAGLPGRGVNIPTFVSGTGGAGRGGD